MSKPYNPLITVCSSCLQAACWQGEFYCDNYISAGIIDRYVSDLCNNGNPREHPDYWNKDLRAKHQRELTLNDLRAHGINLESWDANVS